MKVLLIGGTGNVGSAVVAELKSRGVDVRVLTRKSRNEQHAANGIEFVTGDGLDIATVKSALQGVDKLFLLNGVVPDELQQGLIAVNLTKRQGIKHVVYISVFESQRFPDVPHFAAKIAIEAAIKQSEIPHTILRPNYFFQNDASLKDLILGAGVYPSPIGPQGVSAVDIRDIAQVAAIALTGSGHQGKTYNVVGPEVLTGPRAAATWSELTGKTIVYPGENLDAWEEQMSAFIPPWMAFDLRLMFQGYLERGFTANPGDVETLTTLLGHTPRSYQAFATELASSWKVTQ